MGIWAGATRSSSQGGVHVGLENFIPAGGSGYWRRDYKMAVRDIKVSNKSTLLFRMIKRSLRGPLSRKEAYNHNLWNTLYLQQSLAST